MPTEGEYTREGGLQRTFKEARTQILGRKVINNSTWTKLFEVPGSAYTELKEILLYNGDSSTVNWMIAILNPADTTPSGSSIDQPNVFLSGEIETGKSAIIELVTGLLSGWRVYGFSDAGSGKYFNACLSGVMEVTQ